MPLKGSPCRQSYRLGDFPRRGVLHRWQSSLVPVTHLCHRNELGLFTSYLQLLACQMVGRLTRRDWQSDCVIVTSRTSAHVVLTERTKPVRASTKEMLGKTDNTIM